MPRRTLLVILTLLLSASTARAQCRSVPECLLHLGVGRLDPKIAAIIGAGAGAVALGAAAATGLREWGKKEMPQGVVTTTDENGRPQLQLPLLPKPASLPESDPSGDQTRRAGPMLRFNDTATNIALAAGSAAILTSIIVGIVKK